MSARWRRLQALATGVYRWHVEVQVTLSERWVAVRAYEGDAFTTLLEIDGPRAHEAAEAALLVMSGRGSVVEKER